MSTHTSAWYAEPASKLGHPGYVTLAEVIKAEVIKAELEESRS